MKNIFTTAALSVAIIMASCSGIAAQSNKSAAKDKAPAKTAASSTPGKMKEFMAMLDGTEGSAQKAADAYFSDELKSKLAEGNSLTFTDYIMSSAKVVASNAPCCTMEAKAGVTTRSFKICWQDDKIISIEDLGIK
jgi:hypothetical protein